MLHYVIAHEMLRSEMCIGLLFCPKKSRFCSTVSLSRGKSKDEEAEKDADKPKKRKWGNSSARKMSVDISSASLKVSDFPFLLLP